MNEETYILRKNEHFIGCGILVKYEPLKRTKRNHIIVYLLKPKDLPP